MTTFLRAAGAAGLMWFMASAAGAATSLDAALTYPESIQAITLPSAVECAALNEEPGDVEQASACEPSCQQCDGACCGDACCDDCRDGCCEAAADCGCCNSCCESLPVWTVKAGAVYLTRSRPDSLTTVVPLAGPGRIAGASDYNLGWAAGPDVALLRRTSRGNVWELRYFGALDWDSPVIPYGGVGNVRIGSFSNFGATSLSGNYNTSLHSAELNWRHPHSDRFSWLAGARWIELADDINYDITFPAFSANYNWHNTNHLYGGQLGADLNLWRLTGPLSMNAVFKGGVYGNDANNDFTLRPSTGGQFDGGGAGGDVAFVGEIGATSAYQITPHVALRGGYQLLWIDGVALAGRQAAAATANSTQAGIETRGQAFYHGALMSVDFTW